MPGKKTSSGSPPSFSELESRIFRQSYLDSSDAIMITDAQGTILDVNPAFERIYGYPRREVLGHTPRILRDGSSGPDLYSRMWQEILDPRKGFWKGEITNRRKDGSRIPVMLSITPIRDHTGKTTHYMGLSLDISEKRQLEARVERLRREYGAFLRHEMRNMLAAIVGYLELALHHAEPPGARQKKYLDSAQNSIRSTLQIIEALRELEYYEMGRIQLDRRVVSLASIARRARSHLKPLASTCGVRVLIRQQTTHDQVHVDPPKMESVFVNLLKNAIEHVCGIPGAAVVVCIYDEHGRCAISVNNPGESIPPARLVTFFDRFNTTKKETGGTGLGTTYAEVITRAHGGDIWVESTAMEGTTVTVLLPKPPSTAMSKPKKKRS